MSRPKTRQSRFAHRSVSWLLRGLILALAGAPSLAAQSQSPPAAPADRTQRVLERADRHLLAYATADARQALQPLMKEKSSDGLVAVTLGRVLIQEQAYGDAVAQLEEAAKLDSRSPEPYLYLGEAYQRLERPGPAKQAYAQARDRARQRIKEDPKDGHAYLLFGVAQLGLGGREPALESFTKAHQLDPADPLPPFYMGTIYFAQERWGDAVGELNAALQGNRGIALGYFFRGMAHGKTGRKADMINDLERFVAMAPKAPEAEAARTILNTVR